MARDREDVGHFPGVRGRPDVSRDETRPPTRQQLQVDGDAKSALEQHGHTLVVAAVKRTVYVDPPAVQQDVAVHHFQRLRVVVGRQDVCRNTLQGEGPQDPHAPLKGLGLQQRSSSDDCRPRHLGVPVFLRKRCYPEQAAPRLADTASPDARLSVLRLPCFLECAWGRRRRILVKLQRSHIFQVHAIMAKLALLDGLEHQWLRQLMEAPGEAPEEQAQHQQEAMAIQPPALP